MITENKIFMEDVERICASEFIPWLSLQGKTVFITGGTGLIGTMLVNALLQADTKYGLKMKVVTLVRNLKKAQERFMKSDALEIIEGDVQHILCMEGNVDFIIHAASQTSSKGFMNNPVETIDTVLSGTHCMLDLAKEKKVKRFIFLSTMEVYGYPAKGHKVIEDEIGSFDVTNPRNCYPISKIMAENMILSYCSEYDVPACILRLTQTFGPGVSYNDGRVFAEFARCVIEHRDIVLKTKGETERDYLYVADAVTGILIVLLKGKNRQIYNVANEASYCSIADMAKLVSNFDDIMVRFDLQDVSRLGFANTLYMDLSTKKLHQLGWNCYVGLEEMFKKLIGSMQG